MWKRVKKPLCLVIVVGYSLYFLSSSRTPSYTPQLAFKPQLHPIDTLIGQAFKDFDRLIARQTKDAASAATAYRSRRGRHPPPGFDHWFAYAQKLDAVIVEDFWDQIYDDLEPFWAVPAKALAWQALNMATADCIIHVRNKKAFPKEGCWNAGWMSNYLGAVQKIEDFLPDLDVPINMMDGPRIMVSWEDVDKNMRVAATTKELGKNRLRAMTATYSSRGAYEEEKFKPEFRSGSYVDLLLASCLPHTSAKGARNYTLPATELIPATAPKGSYQGYVTNWTQVTDPCENLNLLGLESCFVSPCAVSTSTQLFPLFSGSKHPTNNDILFPAAKYWDNDEWFALEDKDLPSWSQKQNKVVWKGTASGGEYNEENWMRFQRHRFVTMMNGTIVQQATEGKAPSFRLTNDNVYNVSAGQAGKLSQWVTEHSDASFVDMKACNNASEKQAPVHRFFKTDRPQPMSDQFKNKYVPDIDGNSFSGRYRAFLQSNSVPIKATVFREWHDSRLMPWVHFVPMDNTFVDFYGIMDYFIGSEVKKGHDAMAKLIAEEGQKWAHRAMRREDMLLYVYRLLLEFARVTDERREKLGYVNDLLVQSSQTV